MSGAVNGTAEHSAGAAAHTDPAADTEHLRAADELRRMFVSAAAHDLRSPLAGIRGFAQTLLEREVTAEQHQLFLERIVQAVDRMSRLLEDLLELDPGARGSDCRVSTNVGMLVREVVEMVNPRDHQIEVDNLDEGLDIEVDPLRVGQIVTNLVDNAVTHTPTGTRVVVVTSATSTGVRLVVEDDGPGVSAEIADRMFLPFVTSATGPDNAHSHGLGLSLVKQFVELHDGTVIHQRTEGGGARFIVDLPATMADRESARQQRPGPARVGVRRRQAALTPPEHGST